MMTIYEKEALFDQLDEEFSVRLPSRRSSRSA